MQPFLGPRVARFLGLSLFVLFPLFLLDHSSPAARQKAKVSEAASAKVASQLMNLPLRFEASADKSQFRARGRGYTINLTPDGALLWLRQSKDSALSELKMQFVGSQPKPRVQPQEQLAGGSHYFIGKEAKKWRTNVASYRRVLYQKVYPGIDLVWHGAQQQLEFDFLVAPKAATEKIQLAFNGATLRTTPEGTLEIMAGDGAVQFHKPVAWQEKDGKRESIECAFAINQNRDKVGFHLGAYDKQRPLVIDPVLVYSTYLGGANGESGEAIALDKDRNIYVTGTTNSADFPGPSAIKSNLSSSFNDIYVLKLNPAGTSMLFGTWIGGAGNEISGGLAVDGNGNIYVTGTTDSADFPTTNGSLQRERKGVTDAFVVKIAANGAALSYATLLGGNNTDSGSSLTVDTSGNVYLAGLSYSSNLLTGKVSTAIQGARMGNSIFQSTNRAVSWSAVPPPALDVIRPVAFTYDPKTSGLVYASTSTGIYKSTNNGATWTLMPGTEIFTLSPNSRTNPLVIDPQNNATLYYLTIFGVFKSTNGGQTWTEKTNEITGNFNAQGHILAIDHTLTDTIYLGNQRGLFKSLTGGNTWAKLNLGIGNFGRPITAVYAVAINPRNRLNVFVAHQTGIIQTFDGGATWTPATSGLSSSAVQTLVFDSVTANTLYAGIQFEGIYRTTDGGATWTNRSSGLGINGLAGAIYNLVVDPQQADTVYALVSNGRVFKSTNGGGTWAASNTGITQGNCVALALDPLQPGRMILGANIGADGYVAKLNANGSAVSWMTYLGGSENDILNAIALDKSGNVVVAGGTDSSEIPTLNQESQFTDVFVAKINATGTATIFAAKFGGHGTETAESLVLTANDKAIVSGWTNSQGAPFATTLQPTYGGGNTDAFVAGLNLNGSALEFSTWLGGRNEERANAVALDAAGNIYLAGQTSSANFPLRDAFQTELGGPFTQNVFFTLLNANASAISFSTYLGGSGPDSLFGMALDTNGQAYLVGTTNASNFPMKNPLQATLNGFADAFIAKIGNEADLSLSVAQTRNPVQINNNFTYTINVANNGPANGSAIELTSTLPAGLSYIGVTGGVNCTHANGTVTCNVGTMASGTSKTFQLEAKGVATGSLTNTIRVTGKEPDPNTANNVINQSTSIVNAPSLYGRVTFAMPTGSLQPLAGVAVQISGAQATSRTTNADGNYQFVTNNGGNFTLTPTLTGYSFEPATRALTNVTTDQKADFTAQPCGYSLGAASQSFSTNGGNGTIAVQATARCPWTATTTDSWIRLTGGTQGSGNGTVSFSVVPTTVPRVGKIKVAGINFIVWQGANDCATARFGNNVYRAPFNFPATVQRAIADFNDDKRSDVITLVGGKLSVSTMDSAGLPSTPRLLAEGFLGLSVFGADLNGDNKPEIIIPDASRPVLRVWLNRADGTIATSPTEYILSNDSERFGIMPGFNQDLNKDGKVDLLFTSNSAQFGSPSSAIILLNQGNGTFGSPIRVMLSGRILALADFTNDGVPDLATQDALNGQPVLNVLPGDGFGSFAAAKVSGGQVAYGNAAVADFNGDGNNDLAYSATFFDTQFFSTYLGDGTGKFTEARTSLSDLQLPSLIVTADFNNDAKPDLAYSNLDGIFLAVGSGDGKFARPQAQKFFSGSDYAADLLPGDFNGDGRTDLSASVGQFAEYSIHLNRCGGPAGLVLAGRVFAPDSSQALDNITVKLAGGRTAETRTDLGGNFSFTSLAANTTYTVTPERAGVVFDPPSRRYENLAADQYFQFLAERRAVVTSAANYRTDTFAPGSIVAVFGVDLSGTQAAANTIPLPTLLAGASVLITDTQGYGEEAGIFYASPRQLNLLLPDDLPLRPMTMTITARLAGGTTVNTRTMFNVEALAPGLFAANSTGTGYAAAVALRIRANGAQNYEATSTFDINSLRYLPIPLDVSNANEQVFLLLFGTGLSRHGGLSNVSATIGGQTAEVLFAGPQGGLAGLDQVNLRVPRALTGRGDADIALSVGGKAVNLVKVNIR